MARRGVITMIAGLIGLLARPGPAPAQGPPPTGFYGVVSQDPLGDADLERMGQGRVGTLRVTRSWAQIDSPTLPSGYDWSEFDDLVAASSREGLDILPAVYHVP